MYIVSACLMGEKCRYDGKDSLSEKVQTFLKGKDYLLVCPELMAGLGIPRTPCEILNGRVITKNGIDRTEEFIKGAYRSMDKVRRALEETAKNELDKGLKSAPALNKYRCDIKCAILKSKSPSCGRGRIYDGSFSGRLIDGDGIFARLLLDEGIEVITERDL